MISAIEFKRCVAGADVFGVIVTKLPYGKKLYQIILLEVDKSLELDFYCTILPLNLAVCL